MNDINKLASYDEPVVSIVSMGKRIFVATAHNVYYYENPDYNEPYYFIPLYVRLWRWLRARFQ